MVDARITVKVSDVSISLGNTWVLERVSFDCWQGEWTLIYGPSGSGKSTLLRTINGLRSPTRGRIQTLGTDIPGRRRRDARKAWRQTGTVLQEIALFETKTARENVELALRTAGVDRIAACARAAEWLERLKLGDKLEKYPAHLSGGERQRVALARAFAGHPRLLVLDEPISALDQATAQVALEAVRGLVERGTTVVMSSHRVHEITEMCDQQIALDNGRVANVERGSTARTRLARSALTPTAY